MSWLMILRLQLLPAGGYVTASLHCLVRSYAAGGGAAAQAGRVTQGKP